MTFTRTLAGGNKVPCDLVSHLTGASAKTVQLALEIADENAKSMIECNSIYHQREGVCWMEIDINDTFIARELEYLKLRSLIEFHTDEKNWVRFEEAK